MPNYWQKQSKDKPLFPDILWDKPERRDLSGKLLIVGGSSLGFRAIADAYEIAIDHGIGESHVLVPESLSSITKHLPNVFYGAATNDGSFSTKSKETFFSSALWSEGVLIAGDTGRNSETSLLLSEFCRSYRGKLAITRDSVDSLYTEVNFLLNRPDTLLVLALGQLQRIARESNYQDAFTLGMDFVPFLEKLHVFSTNNQVIIVTKHHDQIIVAYMGQIITTRRDDLDDLWRTEITARAMTSWLHHPNKPLEAISSALYS